MKGDDPFMEYIAVTKKKSTFKNKQFLSLHYNINKWYFQLADFLLYLFFSHEILKFTLIPFKLAFYVKKCYSSFK